MSPKERKVVIDVATAEAPADYHYWRLEPTLFCWKVTKPFRLDIERTQHEIYNDFPPKLYLAKAINIHIMIFCYFEGFPNG